MVEGHRTLQRSNNAPPQRFMMKCTGSENEPIPPAFSREKPVAVAGTRENAVAGQWWAGVGYWMGEGSSVKAAQVVAWMRFAGNNPVRPNGWWTQPNHHNESNHLRRGDGYCPGGDRFHAPDPTLFLLATSRFAVQTHAKAGSGTEKYKRVGAQ
jgi:hypothetical protein